MNTDVRFAAVEVRDESSTEFTLLSAQSWDHATLYAGPGFSFSATGTMKGVSVVPCDGVWGCDGGMVTGVLVGRFRGGIVG